MPLVGNPHGGELASTQPLDQAERVAPVGLHPIARLLRNQRRRHHHARVPSPCAPDPNMIPSMTALTKPRMTVDEFLAWAEGRPGRYELFRGEVYAMSPEVVGHTKIKGLVHAALLANIRQRGLQCHALPDGATVRIDEATAYEPDALVYCGQELPLTALEVPNPIIIVEVL